MASGCVFNRLVSVSVLKYGSALVLLSVKLKLSRTDSLVGVLGVVKN